MNGIHDLPQPFAAFRAAAILEKLELGGCSSLQAAHCDAEEADGLIDVRAVPEIEGNCADQTTVRGCPCQRSAATQERIQSAPGCIGIGAAFSEPNLEGHRAPPHPVTAQSSGDGLGVGQQCVFNDAPVEHVLLEGVLSP